MKYIIVSGGVISGIGKGTVCSSIGVLLKSKGGCVVSHIKIDPYLNYSAGMMAPSEHGEVYVLNDGGETDLDLGNYERFVNIELTSKNAITSGNIFYNLINRERNGEFGGKTLQMNPHIIEEIINRIEEVSKLPVKDTFTGVLSIPDVIIIELGGTVGDFESLMFLEAFYKFTSKLNKQDFIHISVDYLIDLHGTEHKTKPIQNSFRNLRSFGLMSDIMICRTQFPLEDVSINKISGICNIDKRNIYHLPTLNSIYRVPQYLESNGLFDCIKNLLKIEEKPVGVNILEKMNKLTKRHPDSINIGLITKYGTQADSYSSVVHALLFSSYEVGANIELTWIDSEEFETNYESAISKIKECNGILVPGGFGTRGIEGKIRAISYCRENKVPFLGICLGLQLSVIEFVRNVLKIKDATSEEFDPKAENQVITYINHNGTKNRQIRLGSNNIVLKDKSKIKTFYGKDLISERHRHRFEINRDIVDTLVSNGYICSGRSEGHDVPEIFELSDHPFFVGVQFHPEFNASSLTPSPLFASLLKAAYKNMK
ncbi:CTP synthase [Nosema bombycis CQ1]|uniref:CTP synthase n=1 Tax=Nosema bombycis (strain CQ1 / CVCC 102059) TaxID=578461 RepID=R0MK49_NOSB1|nr:CTP synthase [Nosema bombycis CQ1]|eukprot:EOB14615.1 CTP synthase [Nosema bombycis CQ1]